MSFRPAFRRVAFVVASATIALSAGPLAGTALAADPVLAANGRSPASDAVVQPPAAVSACFTSTLLPTSTITLAKGATNVAADPAELTLADCDTGTNNKLVFTPDEALTDGVYTATATARNFEAPTPGETVVTWSFTVDTTAPTAPSALTMTDPVNVANVANATVSGTTDPNTPVGVSVAKVGVPAVTRTGSTTSDGAGAFTVSGLDLTGLGDGQLVATVTATDAAGNAAANTVNAQKDTAVPVRTQTIPANGATSQPRTTVTVTFDQPLNPAASTLVIRNGFGNQVAEAATGSPAFSNGNMTITFTSASTMTASGGVFTVRANVADLAGNPASTATTTFSIDSTAPAAPSVTLTNPVNAANAATAIVSGIAEPGSSVSVSVDDSVSGSPATADPVPAHATTGAYSTTVDLTGLLDGPVTASATATDPAGNTGPAGVSAASAKDTVAPSAPSVTMTDPVTNANQATVGISGTAQPGSVVSISVADTDAGTAHVTKSGVATDPGTGAYATTVDVTPLSDGVLTASVVATDAAGNPSTAGEDTAQMDTGVPALPTLAVPTVNNANKALVPATGVAEPGSTVTVTLSDGVHGPLTQTPTADAEGDYTASFDATGLNDGTLTATAVATDAAGNPSPQKSINVTKDTGVPNAPAVTLPAFVNAATDQAVEVSGTAEAGSTVDITVSDTDAGTTNVLTSIVTAPNGTWTKTVDLTSLTDGAVTASATATDAAGNTSSAGQDTAAKDVAAPAAPVVSLTDPITPANAATSSVSGTAEAGSTINALVNDTDAATAAVPGSGTATGGSFAIAVDLSSLTDGAITATATATDAAGNVSAPGASAASAKDTITLAALSNSPADGSVVQPPATVSMTFNEPVKTSETTITVADASSSALAGATTFANGGRTVVFTPADTLSDAGSPYAVTVIAKDADGTDSLAAGFTFTVDGTKPAMPSISIPEVVNAANVAAVPVSGVAEPGSNVVVSVDDTTAAPAVAGNVVAHATTGAYTLALDLTSLADTALTASATATDVAGNTSDAGADTATKDSTLPGTPTIDLPAFVNAANKAAVPVSGVAEPGSSVLVSVDDATAGAPVTDTLTAHATTGAYSATLDLTALADGALSATAVATDAAGNPSAAGSDTAAKDTVIPVAPTVTLSDPVNAANTTTVSVSGVAEPGSAVAISIDDATPGSPVVKNTTADGTTGAYGATADVTALADGVVTATVVATDAAGNPSAAGSDTATKDSTLPGTPTVDLPAFVNAANKAAVPVSGVAEAGSSVLVSVDDATPGSPVSDTVTAHATTGAYTATLDLTPLADGTVTATAVATDGVGNSSTAGTDTAAKDTVVPGTPALDLPAFVNGANKAAVPVSGVAEPGSSVLVSVDDATAGAPVTDTLTAHATTGAYSTTLDLTGLADGALSATAVATDAAANPSAAGSDTSTKDTVVPGTPTLDLPVYVTAANQAAAPVSGIAEPGSSVLVSVDDATPGSPVTGTVTADGTTGSYATALDLTALADGPVSATAVATDAASNASAAGSDTAVKDTVVPATPTVSIPEVVNAASVAAVTVSGAADPGTSVLVSVDDATPGDPVTDTVTADGTTGAYTTTLNLTTLDDGALTATAVSSDTAGNPSVAATDTATKDATVPGAPTVELTDPVNAANKTTITVSGVAEPGSAVSISLDDATVGDPLTASKTADATTGAYSATFDVTALNDGVLTATVTATDAALNTSPAGVDTATKDSAIPDVPVLNAVAEVTHATFTAAPFSGTGEAGRTVTVTVNDADATTDPVSGTATIGGDGAWTSSLDLSSLQDGALTVVVTVTDAAGNVSAPANGATTKNVQRAFTFSASGTPVSGATQAFTVTAHTTYQPGSGTDTAYTGTPVLTSGDGHFTAGACGAAVAGVASCTGTVFGDLGAQTLTATGGSTAEPVSGTKAVVVQPTGLVFTVAPATKTSPGVSLPFTTVPTVGVPGASTAGYNATRTLVTTGGSTPSTGTVLTCPVASCDSSVSFFSRGPKTVKVVDNGTPALSTPVAAVTVPYVTKLSLATSKSLVTAGGTMVLSGKLTNTTTLAGVSGRTVRIYRRVAPAKTYSYYTSITTRADGTWAKRVTLTRNTAFQARFAGDATHLATNSTAKVVKAAQAVSATWSSSGRTVKASGRISPNASGRTVSLQYRKADGTWAYAGAQATVTSTGTYVLSRTFAAGQYALRVYIPATTLNAAGVSTTLSIRLV